MARAHPVLCVKVLQKNKQTKKKLTKTWALPSNSSSSPRPSRLPTTGAWLEKHMYISPHRYGFPGNPGELCLFSVSTREPQLGVGLTSKCREEFPRGSLPGRTHRSLGSSRPALAQQDPGYLSASLLLSHLLTSVSARISPISGHRCLLCLPSRIRSYPAATYLRKILSLAIHHGSVLLPHSDNTIKIEITATRKPPFSLSSNM